MKKRYVLNGTEVTEKRAYDLYHVLKLREAYNDVICEHTLDKSVIDTMLPLYNSNDKRLRRLGRSIWGRDWDSHSRKHDPMSWRNIHSTQLEGLGIEY